LPITTFSLLLPTCSKVGATAREEQPDNLEQTPLLPKPVATAPVAKRPDNATARIEGIAAELKFAALARRRQELEFAQ